MTEAEEPRQINPVRFMSRGEDTLDEDDNLIFSDFRPNVLPADTPEAVVEVVVPKDSSAQGLAPSSESRQTSEPPKSENPVPAPAAPDAGATKPDESSKQTSSSPKKTG